MARFEIVHSEKFWNLQFKNGNINTFRRTNGGRYSPSVARPAVNPGIEVRSRASQGQPLTPGLPNHHLKPQQSQARKKEAAKKLEKCCEIKIVLHASSIYKNCKICEG
jgi:hypothetical protein